MKAAFLLLLPSLVLAQTPFIPDARTDYKVCGYTIRNSDGGIKRDMSVVNAFQRLHPCPVTGRKTGACPGWAVDHVIPLACGGCDSVTNMQWLPRSIKSAAATATVLPKDRFERKINCTPQVLVPDAGASAP